MAPEQAPEQAETVEAPARHSFNVVEHDWTSMIGRPREPNPYLDDVRNAYGDPEGKGAAVTFQAEGLTEEAARSLTNRLRAAGREVGHSIRLVVSEPVKGKVALRWTAVPKITKKAKPATASTGTPAAA